jgi:hypothetical protein
MIWNCNSLYGGNTSSCVELPNYHSEEIRRKITAQLKIKF